LPIYVVGRVASYGLRVAELRVLSMDRRNRWMVLDRINRINKIFILHFQFPEDTENIQSPSANKIGIINTLIRKLHKSR
jgi:hypothetical protein